MVPALVQLLRYRKVQFKAFDALWEKVGEIPIKATVLVILVTVVFTVWGGLILKEELGKGITGASEEVPPGLESYETLRAVSYTHLTLPTICSV